jgi:hypothetical protein
MSNEGLGTNAFANGNGFRVSCGAGKAGDFGVETDALWVKVGQLVRRQGTEVMWYSVAVEGTKEGDGTLSVRILVFNPDCDEPLQVACIRSRPLDAECLTVLGCNLEHVSP